MVSGASSGTTGSSQLVRFGVFEADLGSGELRKGGIKVKIQDLPFQALRALVSRPNEVISREDLRKVLWPEGVFVDFDRGITSAMNRLRDALGDSAENPVFVETVGRRGYRWIAPTHLPPVAAIPEPALPRSPNIWTGWKMIFVLPVVALLFAAWIFRPNYRSVKAEGTPSLAVASPTASGLHPANREAEDLYLQGRFYWNKRTPDDLNKAVDYFTQAIVHDPTYAKAYVGLADCYNLLREYTAMSSQEAYARALAAAKKAVELDPNSSEAHNSLAFISLNSLWDAPTAEREFQRAIELDPKNPVAHHWYATCLSTLERYPEALAQIEEAQALDPNSSSILADKGRILWLADRHEDAFRLLKQLEAAEPDFVSPHRYLRLAYLEVGDYPEYLAEFKKEALLTHDPTARSVADAADRGFREGGGRRMLQNQLRVEKKLYDAGHYSPALIAQTCSVLGEKSEAIQYLRATFDQRADGAIQIPGDPLFENLHRDPAYRQSVAGAGLTWAVE